VKLRFFVGLSAEEAAEVLGVSVPTVKRHWAYAKAWLYRQMAGG
jgi:DNA-directed RNA polymerase specialized sigma24 family protein